MNSEKSFETLSEQEFLGLGLDHMAYIRPLTAEDGAMVFGVFSANGQRMAVLANAEVAVAAIKQHDLEPVWLH